MIQLTRIWKLGNNHVEITSTGETLKDALKVSENQVPDNINECGICGSKELDLAIQKWEKDGNSGDFVKVRCRDCNSSLIVKENKKTGGFYIDVEEESRHSKTVLWYDAEQQKQVPVRTRKS